MLDILTIDHIIYEKRVILIWYHVSIDGLEFSFVLNGKFWSTRYRYYRYLRREGHWRTADNDSSLIVHRLIPSSLIFLYDGSYKIDRG